MATLDRLELDLLDDIALDLLDKLLLVFAAEELFRGEFDEYALLEIDELLDDELLDAGHALILDNDEDLLLELDDINAAELLGLFADNAGVILNQLILKPPIKELILKKYRPPFNVSVFSTVVQTCHPPVLGTVI